MLRFGRWRILIEVLPLVILLLGTAAPMLDNHFDSRVIGVYSSYASSTPPLLTNAGIIDSGAFSTRSWSTEKHMYSSTGIPSNGTLVEIRGAVLSSVTNGAASGDCNDSSDVPMMPSGSWCDSTANASDGSGSVHVEIDQVFKYLGIAPADWPVNGATVNITGYTFYDGENGGSPTSPVPGGWEIHPVTSWHLSNSSAREFVLTLSSGLGGSTSPGPGSYSVSPGDTVTVRANPSSGYSFKGFILDGVVSTTNPVIVTMDRDHVLSASFAANGQGPWNVEIIGLGAIVTLLGVSFLQRRRSARKRAARVGVDKF